MQAKDISLGAGARWTGGASDGTTLWFVSHDVGDQAIAYVAATRARDSGKDIDLPVARNKPGMAEFPMAVTLWFVKGLDDRRSIIAYLASDQSRQSADDITHADLAGVLTWRCLRQWDRLVCRA